MLLADHAGAAEALPNIVDVAGRLAALVQFVERQVLAVRAGERAAHLVNGRDVVDSANLLVVNATNQNHQHQCESRHLASMSTGSAVVTCSLTGQGFRWGNAPAVICGTTGTDTAIARVHQREVAAATGLVRDRHIGRADSVRGHDGRTCVGITVGAERREATATADLGRSLERVLPGSRRAGVLVHLDDNHVLAAAQVRFFVALAESSRTRGAENESSHNACDPDCLPHRRIILPQVWEVR